MNILILNWKDIQHPERGGAEIIAHFYARNLVKEGHTVTFFSRCFQNCDPETVIDGVNIVRRGNLLSTYWEAYKYYRSLKVKPDKVIDMVNTLAWQTPFYVPKENRILYVNQLAQEVFWYQLPVIPALVGYLLEPFQFLSYRSTRTVVYSRSTASDLQKMGIPFSYIHNFSMGLDHKQYFVGGKKEEKPTFLFVARLVKMKRCDLCLKAFAELCRIEPHAQFKIVGYGPEKYALQRLAKELGISMNVEFVTEDNFFLEHHASDPKVHWMQRSWALLLPSVKEGWGMVVTEAAACGTPSLVSNVTGLRDSVLHEKTGLVLSTHPSTTEMARAMLRIIRDTDKRERLRAGAIAWAKNFTWEKSYMEFKKAAGI